MTIFKSKNVFESQRLWQQFVIVLFFNTFIALFIHSISSEDYLLSQFVTSQSIGLSIFVTFLVSSRFIELNKWNFFVPLFIGSLIGITIGIAINAIMNNASFDLVLAAVQKNYQNILNLFFIALFFGTIILFFFLARENILRTKTKLQAEKIDNLDKQKKIAETRLRLLQAQIEPHFLFNTLSNVISLIDTEPQKSKKLLESLTQFLRSTLNRSTDIHQHLSEEIKLISNYLDIQKIRMGTRLEYDVNYGDDVLDCSFPPFLLQPLVENAVIHGIEPQTEGGVIVITVQKENAVLEVSVADTGLGLSGDLVKGFGLTNIRKRIKSIYGDAGSLVIEQSHANGVTATIRVPYEKI